MAHYRGMAAIHRGRTTAYAAGLAALVLASPAAAQSTGGATPADPPARPQLSAPPPGVVVRPAPRVTSWKCARSCENATTGSTGALLRLRGRALGRTYEVVFLGGPGAEDDVAAAPLKRKKTLVIARVPLGAASGPLVVADRDGLQSQPSPTALTVAAPAATKLAGTAPTIEVQTRARRAFFDAARPATVSYVVHGDSPARVLVELVRSGDGAVVGSWDQADIPPEATQTVTWSGMSNGRLQKEGRYSFRVTSVSAAGLRTVSAQAATTEPDPAAFRFLRNEFPIRGPHGYGEAIARFGGARHHQGQDVFAACGTPLVAARGGVVKFKQYHSRAGNYLIIDGEKTGIDYGYMHLRAPALVDARDRVRTGQPIGYVGRTGDATACHLHFEMWTAPGWYDGGQPFDPLPSLMAWDKTS
jgi:murein DD-endopeptidase MepM/ murein hydrolase activator NlpD